VCTDKGEGNGEAPREGHIATYIEPGERSGKTLRLSIDGIEVQVPEGTTVLRAAERAGVRIPTMCYLEDLNAPAACRLCLVQVEGRPTLDTACVLPAEDGMTVYTSTPEVLAARKQVMELYLSDHPFACLTCERNQNCELQTLAKEFGVRDLRYEGSRNHFTIDDLSPSVVREPDKCVRCRRCLAVCEHYQAVGIYRMIERSYRAVVAPVFNTSLADTPCILCGQCITVCPTAALREKDGTNQVWEALGDTDKIVVVQTAPSVRVSIGEEFGYPVGTNLTGAMVSALRRLGFDYVFDTCLTADLVVMEEAHELMGHLERGGPFPLFTSCCPSWVLFCESFYPQFIERLSTCKSPQAMMGALLKTWWADRMDLDPDRIYSVSVMPCVSKKFEIERPEMKASGRWDMDAVLTVRELAQMMFQAGLDPHDLPPAYFDHPLGAASGAGIVFGGSGGVTEGVLRTVFEKVTGRPLGRVEFDAVRSMEYKETEIDLDGFTLKVAVARGTGTARRLLEAILQGRKEYHFVEVMACPGGCVGGGGQPIYTETNKWGEQIRHRTSRTRGLYRDDRDRTIRKSHENPHVQRLYREFLGHPGSRRARDLLHMSYVERRLYNPEPRPELERPVPLK